MSATRDSSLSAPTAARLPARGFSPWLAAPLLLALLAACGPDTPEARLEQAGRQVESADARLESLSEEIESLESRLAEKRAERRDVRDRLRTLEEKLDARATDVAIFRAVQSALLQHDALKQHAISVDVEERAVTLRGIVPSEDKRQEAVSLARGTAGVESVTSRIQVDPAKGNSG